MKTWAEQIDAGGNLRLIRDGNRRVAIAALEFMEMVEAGTAIVPDLSDVPPWEPPKS